MSIQKDSGDMLKRCSLFQTADILGKKWTLLILYQIVTQRSNGFNAICKQIKSITPKLLSKRLKELENEFEEVKKKLGDGE